MLDIVNLFFRTQLVESREEVRLMRKSALKLSPQSAFSPTSTVAITGHYDIRIDTCQSVTEILEEAKKNVKKLKRKEKKLKGYRFCVIFLIISLDVLKLA